MKQIVMYSPANFSPRKTGEISTKARPMTVLDYGFLAVDFGFQVLDSNLFLWNLDSGFQSFSVEPRFWIPIFFCGTWILDSNLKWDSGFLVLYPDSKAQDSGIHEYTFPGFQNPDSLTCGDKAYEGVLQRAREQGSRCVQSTFWRGFLSSLAGSFFMLLLLLFSFCYKAAIRSLRVQRCSCSIFAQLTFARYALILFTRFNATLD